MSDQIMTTQAELAAIVPQVWSKQYYDVLLANLPFQSLISQVYGQEISQLGDTVNIFSVPQFAEATELAEGAKGDADAVTVAPQQLVINKRTYKDFIVTKKAQLQSLEFMNELRDRAIYSIQARMETVIVASIVPAAGNALSYTNAGTLALADILAAKRILDAKNVPLANRQAVLDTSRANDIFNITQFTNSQFGGNTKITDGVMGASLLGFQPNMTTRANGVSYFFHPSFMTMAVQQGINVAILSLESEGKRASRVNVDTLWGLKTLDSNRVVTIS